MEAWVRRLWRVRRRRQIRSDWGRFGGLVGSGGPKHVFQLFGTVVAARIEHPAQTVTGTFTTSTMLSERAKRFADELEITVEERVSLKDYPRIECNIARDGERIYHLPFDQQYDRTVIEPDRGERYASSVAEAEHAGFRRAWRWHGNTDAAQLTEMLDRLWSSVRCLPFHGTPTRGTHCCFA